MEPARSEHRFSWWRQGVLLFDEDYDWSDGRVECVEAEWTGAWLGESCSGGVTYVSPGGAMFGSTEARLTVELLARRRAGGPKADSVGVRAAHEREPFDEVIISTLPTNVSRWLRLDLPARVRRLGLPVSVVTPGRADREFFKTG